MTNTTVKLNRRAARSYWAHIGDSMLMIQGNSRKFGNYRWVVQGDDYRRFFRTLKDVRAHIAFASAA